MHSIHLSVKIRIFSNPPAILEAFSYDYSGRLTTQQLAVQSVSDAAAANKKNSSAMKNQSNTFFRFLPTQVCWSWIILRNDRLLMNRI